MKTLTLLRHAKSSWAEPGAKDFDRPLNQRGREAARLVGRALKRRELRFDIVLASPAVRVRETLQELEKAYGSQLDISFDEQIYLASPKTLLSVVRALPDTAESVLLIGHNPGMHQFALELSVEDDGLRQQIAGKYPTGALASIELPIDRWRDAGDQPGTISALILPRELAS